ncbi:MAG: type II toxin-antitoxin system HicB family antitoxin [Methyloprofundus sp.]|nr:type II toxin-antitoxin system HicB family antitoxin [Methyloprofundus sp.]
MKYAVVIEQADSNYSAYVPDLPGCVATGATIKDAENEIREAIKFHIEGMKEDGLLVSSPGSAVV